MIRILKYRDWSSNFYLGTNIHFFKTRTKDANIQISRETNRNGEKKVNRWLQYIIWMVNIEHNAFENSVLVLLSKNVRLTFTLDRITNWNGWNTEKCLYTEKKMLQQIYGRALVIKIDDICSSHIQRATAEKQQMLRANWYTDKSQTAEYKWKWNRRLDSSMQSVLVMRIAKTFVLKNSRKWMS